MEFNPLDYPITYTLPEIFSGCSAWIEHIPFGFLLMQMLRPEAFVELGTLMGDSYFAFCQAVAQLGLPTRCHAVDHWLGDEHAGPINPEAVYNNLKNYHDPRYGGFSQLIRSSFDDAAGRFKSGQVDLLHIDGLHTYEAVKHDYETWLPKMSNRGVIFFHDTVVRKNDFAVWKLWQEITPGRPHFEFLHGHGLGVLAVGSDVPAHFVDFLNLAAATPDPIRQFFAAMGSRVKFFQAQFIFVQQMIAQRALVQQWGQFTGRAFNLPPFTQAEITFQPQVHAATLTKDFQAVIEEAMGLYRQLHAGKEIGSQ